ncbi:hypothetical protein AMJ85_04420 [candidate division BRC1 bacterium SM23_51]|nr:MAG: hypothetical protein AMJ85_04420 [candidate division BRC1 bacterium SM23_51]
MDRGGDFDEFKRRVREGVEGSLPRYFSTYPDTEISRVAKYVVLGGGHRWRAIAAVAAGEIFHRDAYHICMPAACGVELAHAASLLLDDLPSMDDAKVRRAKPCAHLVFPRWAVDLAPVFLVNMAYGISLQNPLASQERRVMAALELSKAGLHMFEGQEIDIVETLKAVDEQVLLECYRLKSGALYGAAIKGGAILCGAGESEAALLYECGIKLGLAYQFLDDLADVLASAEDVGKQPGMSTSKCTAVDLYDVDGAKSLASRFKRDALSELEQFGPEANTLRSLVYQASCAA